MWLNSISKVQRNHEIFMNPCLNKHACIFNWPVDPRYVRQSLVCTITLPVSNRRHADQPTQAPVPRNTLCLFVWKWQRKCSVSPCSQFPTGTWSQLHFKFLRELHCNLVNRCPAKSSTWRSQSFLFSSKRFPRSH